MKGLAPHTASIFEPISRLECIKPYLLVGGTALSLQLGTRQSEDLDFMSWRKSRTEKREVDWPRIKKELESVGTVEKCDILDIDHVEFIVNGVKLSFYANPNYSPVKEPVAYLNNIVLADMSLWNRSDCLYIKAKPVFQKLFEIYFVLFLSVLAIYL